MQQVELRLDKGIVVREGERTLHLDPTRERTPSVISHAHADHASANGLMTPPTRDVLQVRTGASSTTLASLGSTTDHGGFEVTLHNAGHVLGSAMVQLGGLLYTGDLNPEGALTVPPAQPIDCSTLLIEATFGHPRHRFPPKQEVIRDMQLWAQAVTETRSLVLGGYTFGKSQELIALLNAVDVPVMVTPDIAAVAAVYRAHDIPLRYEVLEGPEAIPSSPHAAILPREGLSSKGGAGAKGGLARELGARYRAAGAAFGYSSGWCATWNLARSWGLEAQFPLSDHADFDALMQFIGGCDPDQVYTVYGEDRALADAVQTQLGITAGALRDLK